MSIVIHNGDHRDSSTFELRTVDRAFLYGDGCFETIRIIDGAPVFLNEHVERAKKTLRFLGIEEPEILNPSMLHSLIANLCVRNKIIADGKCRITLWRNSGGLYSPTSDSCQYLISCENLDTSGFTLNPKGLTIDVYQGTTINPAPLSSYKTINALPYVLAAKWAKEVGVDDVVLTDPNMNLIEATSSNLFLLIEGSLITPDLKHGGLYGTMRGQILKMANSFGIETKQIDVRTHHLQLADEVFLTNAISGIKWVSAYKNKRYFKRLSTRIINELNRSSKINSGLDPQEN